VNFFRLKFLHVFDLSVSGPFGMVFEYLRNFFDFEYLRNFFDFENPISGFI
jgi:hypothetical protein